jgi:hypothetical protein
MRVRLGVPAIGRRNRRGAIAAMAALMITAVMMLGAVAIDYGRMQYFRAQLRTAADAAAHSGAVVMSETNSIVGVPDSARATGMRDVVNGQAPIIDFADIKLGHWDDIASTLDTIAPIDGYDAVKVTARYNGTFLLANRLFGTTGGQLKVTSVAWTRGSVVNTECLKPWAIPYAALLGSIGENPANSAYDLTDTDINELNAGTMSSPIKIALGGSEAGNIYWNGGDYAGQNVQMYTSGNFGHLNLDPDLTYEEEIGQCAANDITVGEGVNLDSTWTPRPANRSARPFTASRSCARGTTPTSPIRRTRRTTSTSAARSRSRSRSTPTRRGSGRAPRTRSSTSGPWCSRGTSTTAGSTPTSPGSRRAATWARRRDQ